MHASPFRRALPAVLPLFVLILGTNAPVSADPPPGQVLATQNPTATPLRVAPLFTAKTVANLSQRTSVTVTEAPGNGWIKVTAQVAGRPVAGWMRATQAVPPHMIPTGPAVVAGGARGVSQADVSAAGRQFDAETERRYRTGRANLNSAYPAVDAMEVASRTMDPDEIEAFVRAGQFGGGRPVRRGPLSDPTLIRFAKKAEGPKAKDVVDKGLDVLEGFGIGKKKQRELIGAAAQGGAGYFDAMSKSFDPVQEYYLGRAVAANAIAQQGLDPDVSRRAYVQLLGQAIVRTTGRVAPTLGGFHFDVLNSDDVNGVSGPGGYVLVTRGAVRACRNEDELAAVLMHEIAHVQGKHGERVIRESGVMQARLKAVGGLASAAMDSEEWKQGLTSLFDKVVEDFVGKAMEHAYSQGVENESDLQGSYILAETGFDYWALRDVLRSLAGTAHRHVGASHAPPEARAAWLHQQLSRTYQAYAYPQAKALREARFREQIGLTAGAGSPAFPPR